MLRCSAGLLAPDSGSVTLDGEPLGTVSRGRVGINFQSPESQLFAESVLEDVAFGPANQGLAEDEAEARAREALIAVGLDPDVFAARSPFGLSGGEARRAALAGVLAMRPAYLLADEPTAGLDASGRALIKDVFRSIRASAGLMIVTHDAEEFIGEADRLLVLLDGHAVFHGPIPELLDDPRVLLQPGLRPPALLELQLRLAECGIDLGRASLDEDVVASTIARQLSGGAS